MISACLVIYNEEELLPRCLESIKDAVGEIIVVHDGPCSDKSLEIAKNFGAKVFEREHIGEAEYHRPFCYSQASGDWVLHIDADEFLSPELSNKIPKLVADNSVDAYAFGWPVLVRGEYLKSGYLAREPRTALFRKDKMYMLGLTHEHPRTYGVTRNLTHLVLEHRPSNGKLGYTLANFRGEGLKRSKIRAKQLLELNTLPTFNIPNKEVNPTLLFYQTRVHHPCVYLIYDTLRMLASYLTKGVFWSGEKSVRAAVYRIAMNVMNYYFLVSVHREENA